MREYKIKASEDVPYENWFRLYEPFTHHGTDYIQFEMCGTNYTIARGDSYRLYVDGDRIEDFDFFFCFMLNNMRVLSNMLDRFDKEKYQESKSKLRELKILFWNVHLHKNEDSWKRLMSEAKSLVR